MPIRSYTNWNVRQSDRAEQIEPYRKYVFICEGAKTEPSYFRRLIDIRKQLGIHPLIDLRLWEKTDEDKNLSFAKNLVKFAKKQKNNPDSDFDRERPGNAPALHPGPRYRASVNVPLPLVAGV